MGVPQKLNFETEDTKQVFVDIDLYTFLYGLWISFKAKLSSFRD